MGCFHFKSPFPFYQSSLKQILEQFRVRIINLFFILNTKYNPPSIQNMYDTKEKE